MTQQPSYQAPAQGKVTDPFWFRKNHTWLAGVTNAPSNPMLGIANIKLKEATPAQAVHGFLYNGMLSLAIGTVSFQIRVSQNGAPMVITESRKTGTDPTTGKDTYFETVFMNPQAKAQILRFMEAVRSGQFVQQQQPVAQYQQTQQPVYQQQVPAYQQQQTQAPTYQAYTPQYDLPTQNLDNQAPVHEVAGAQVPVGSGAPVAVGDDDLPF